MNDTQQMTDLIAQVQAAGATDALLLLLSHAYAAGQAHGRSYGYGLIDNPDFSEGTPEGPIRQVLQAAKAIEDQRFQQQIENREIEARCRQLLPDADFAEQFNFRIQFQQDHDEAAALQFVLDQRRLKLFEAEAISLLPDADWGERFSFATARLRGADVQTAREQVLALREKQRRFQAVLGELPTSIAEALQEPIETAQPQACQHGA